MTNIRQLQTSAIERMLQFGAESIGSTSSSDPAPPALAATNGTDGSASASHQWKILIFDDLGQRLLSALFTTKQLNAYGVTLYLHIKQRNRDQLQDVPAVYFLKPTAEAIKQFAHDISVQHLYASYHLHCISPIRRVELEQLATATVNDSHLIHRLYDQYLDYISLDTNLVTLGHSQSYFQLNNPATTEQQLFSYIDTVVDQLFHLIVTIGQIPIIRCRPGEAAEQVARRLDTKLREHLLSKNNLFSSINTSAPTAASSTLTTHRPLLVLLDRNLDLNAPLCHSWSYESLLNDLLGMSSNKVTVNDSESSTKRSQYDLNTSDDSFYRKYHHAVFHEVSQAIVDRQQRYQADVKAIQQRTGANIDADNPQAAQAQIFDSNSASAGLSDAISVLPKMQKTKKMIDKHINLATALLKTIQQREIDLYYRQQLAFMSNKSAPRNELMQLISTESSPKKGNFTDQLRTFLIYYLSSAQANDALISEIQPHLQRLAAESGGDAQLLSAIEYAKNFKFYHKLGSDISTGVRASDSNASATTQQASTGSSIFDSLAQNVIGQATDWLQGVKKLLPTSNDLPITRITDLLLSNRDTVDTQSYLYFDPRYLKGNGPITSPQLMTATNFHDALVCVLGGGSYYEYQNLQSYLSASAAERGVNSITYVATELTSPLEFVQQLARLGRGEADTSAANVPVD